MSYGEKPPAKKTPNPPNFQPRPPKAKASGSAPPRQPMPKGPGSAKGPVGPVKQKYATDPARTMSTMLPMKPKAAGSVSTTKKVKSFMKKYGQA